MKTAATWNSFLILGGEMGSDNRMMDTGSKEGNQDEVPNGSREPPATRDREMDMGELPEQEDSPLLPRFRSEGANKDSLAGLSLFVAWQFLRYTGQNSMDVVEGWENVFIMLGEFGTEIDKEIDEAMDLVIQDNNTDDIVRSEAAKWNVPIVGVEEIKRVIRGLVNICLILLCSTLSHHDKKQALKHARRDSARMNTMTPIFDSKKTLEERANKTAKREENLLDGSKGEGQQSISVSEDAGNTGWNFEANYIAIDDGGDNMQTSTPTGRSQGDRTIEPPQETQGEDSLPSPMAQEAGNMACDSSRPGRGGAPPS